MINLPCIVEYVRYREDKGFAVLSCNLNAFSSEYNESMEELLKQNIKDNKYDNFTVTIGMLDKNENPKDKQYVFSGDFASHPKFGAQFKAEFYYQDIPKTSDGLKIYLMSLPNIKQARSTAIIEKFGVEKVLDIMQNDYMKLTEINGITEARALIIKQAWDKDKQLRELYTWLSKHGVSLTLAKKIYENWQGKSVETLTENPYKLTDIKGIGFSTADDVAHKIMPVIPKDYRLKSCMQYVLNENLFKNSNLCMPANELKNRSIDLIKESDAKRQSGNDINEYIKIFNTVIKANIGTFAAVKNEAENTVYIYLHNVWRKEKYISNALYKQHSSDQKKQHYPECTEQQFRDIEADVSRINNRPVVFDAKQKEAIKSAFDHKITVITGPAGTGKSSISRGICYLANTHNLSLRLMSPTGKAAQNLGTKTKSYASTIHRSLKMKPGDDIPKEMISEAIIIIDEASMIGIDTMYAIMKSMENNPWGHLIFVGDSNQLPSVSAGNFLFDIVASGCANVVKLDTIYRQSDDSYISVLANEISRGKIVEIPENASDVKWHNIGDMDGFTKSLQKDVKAYIDNGGDINELQIIAPMYRGNAGINKINDAIQDMMADYNKTKELCLELGFNKFYLKDRVLQTQNDAQREIFNGDMGTIVELGTKIINPALNDKKEDFVVVNFYGETVLYVGEQIDQLKVSWCCSVHKFQGSQSPYIIFVITDENTIMASKEILYTSLSRAEKKIDIYGHLRVFNMCSMKSVIARRYSNVVTVVRELRENKKLLKILE